jgi:UDP-N-acetylglucosamine/UDP-N-acetylgalactosamine diphosphorylase
VVRWWDELDAGQRRSLLRQIDAVDFELIGRLLKSPPDRANAGIVVERARHAMPPSEIVRLPGSPREAAAWDEAVRRGREVLAAGRVGVVLVAGGQATRLAFPHPKGTYAIGPVSGCSLFQILAEQLLARSRQAGAGIPYYLMTSEATHDETIAFFAEHNHFGLNPDDVFFFQQGNMPAVDDDAGRLLLAEKGKLSTSPDGHGGLLAALARAGLLDEMRSRGIEYLYYHQVDNPTAIVCDPAFVGFHVLRRSEMSTKVVAKRSPEERMGVVVGIDGQTQIVEYSDLPLEAARQRDEAGNLLLWAGSTAIHLFNRELLDRLIGEELGLPFHLAHKSVPHLNDAGEVLTPDEPNAYKFERFIFDALPHAANALVVEADRAREFNPIKNAEGDDSPATAQAAMISIFKNWLRQAGVTVPDDVPVEISPLFALDEADVKAKIAAGTSLSRPAYLQ